MLRPPVPSLLGRAPPAPKISEWSRSQSTELLNLEAGLAGVVSDGIEVHGSVLTLTLKRQRDEMLGINVGMRCGELVVNRVTHRGLAEKAGIEEGDIITHANGAECWRIEELKTLIATCDSTTQLILRRPEPMILLSDEADVLLDHSWVPVTLRAYSNNVVQFLPKSHRRSAEITISQLQCVELSDRAFDLVMAERTLKVRFESKAPLSAWLDFFRVREVPVTEPNSDD